MPHYLFKNFVGEAQHDVVCQGWRAPCVLFFDRMCLIYPRFYPRLGRIVARYPRHDCCFWSRSGAKTRNKDEGWRIDELDVSYPRVWCIGVSCKILKAKEIWMLFRPAELPMTDFRATLPGKKMLRDHRPYAMRRACGGVETANSSPVAL